MSIRREARILLLVSVVLTGAPAAAQTPSASRGFAEGQLVLSLDSTPVEIAEVGGSLELAKLLSQRWSVGLGFEALKDSSPRGIVESESVLGLWFLIARHARVTDRLSLQINGGAGLLKETTDFPGLRRVDNSLAFSFGFAVPIRVGRRQIGRAHV